MSEVYDFGKRLKELRQKKGLSQAEVAKKIGLNSKTVSNYERNIVTPSLEVMISLADLYGASIDYILNRDKRFRISLEGLTDRQQEAIEQIVKITVEEFKRSK